MSISSFGSFSLASQLYLQGAPPATVVGSLLDELRTYLQRHDSDVRESVSSWLFNRTIDHPVAQRFPPRETYSQAVLRCLAQTLQTSSLLNEAIAQSPDDGDDIVTELEVRFAEMLGTGPHTGRHVHDDAHHRTVSIAHKVFAVPPVQPLRTDHCDDAAWLVAMGVGPQFANVGMSLWPSAFISVLLLRDGMFGGSLHRVLAPHIGKDAGSWSLVELGAGVGLSGAVMQRWLGRATLAEDIGEPRRCILTDYQPGILENTRANLEANSPLHAKWSAECHLLDWMLAGTDDQQALWQSWAPRVILAADCIYDVDVIDGLVRTLREGLQASDTHDKAVALVVQTHRQQQTMAHFAAAVAALPDIQCQSFRVELVPSAVTDAGLCLSDLQLCHAVLGSDGSLTSEGCATTPATTVPSLRAHVVDGFFVEMCELIGVHILTHRR